MPSARHKARFNNNEFYHIYNRGVERRDIFIIGERRGRDASQASRPLQQLEFKDFCDQALFDIIKLKEIKQYLLE